MATTTPNRLSVGVATPQLNTRDFIIQPLQTMQGALMGSAVANTAIDDIMIRPKERANVIQSINESMRARPHVTDATIKEAGAQGQESDFRKEGARRGLELLKDPEYLVSEAEGQLSAYQSDVLRAKEDYQKALNDPALTDEDREKAQKKATDSEAKATAETVKWSRTLLERQAKRTASVNSAKQGEVDSSTALENSQSAARIQPILAETNMIGANTQRTAAGTASDLAALERSRAAGAIRAAPQVQIAAEETMIADTQDAINAARLRTNPEIVALNQDVAIDVAKINAETTRTQALVDAKNATVALLQSGQPQLNETTTKALEKAGLTTVNPATGKQWTPVEATNLVNGAGQVQELRKQADTAAATLESAKGVLEILDGGVDTGALYGLPGVSTVDRVMAQLGYEDAQKREMLKAHSIAFMAQIRKNFPGQVSNFEMNLYESASPAVKNSAAANRAIAYAALASAQRLKEMPAFIQSRLGAMSYDQAEDEWNTYVATNPSITKSADGNLAPNPYRLSPDEWTEAKGNPEQVIRNKALEFARDPQWTNSLPVVQVVNGKTYGNDLIPFVVAVDPQTGKRAVVDNDAFWDKVLQ